MGAPLETALLRSASKAVQGVRMAMVATVLPNPGSNAPLELLHHGRAKPQLLGRPREEAARLHGSKDVMIVMVGTVVAVVGAMNMAVAVMADANNSNMVDLPRMVAIRGIRGLLVKTTADTVAITIRARTKEVTVNPTTSRATVKALEDHHPGWHLTVVTALEVHLPLLHQTAQCRLLPRPARPPLHHLPLEA